MRNLLNLLNNSAKHTSVGEIHLQVTRPINQGCLCFSIADTGEGVNELEHDIWSPFVSGDGSTGLGLFAVKMQTEALGGVCGMESNPTLQGGRHTQGARFWFTIPYDVVDTTPQTLPVASCSQDSTPSPDMKEQQQEPVVARVGNNASKGSILLIDDTAILLTLQGC